METTAKSVHAVYDVYNFTNYYQAKTLSSHAMKGFSIVKI